MRQALFLRVGIALRILLVDRDVVVAAMYRLGLEQEGFEVDEERSAVAMYGSITASTSAIVMEWEDLGGSGPEILRHVRRSVSAKSLPILILTNRDGDIERLSELAVEAGAQTWLVKAHTTPSDLATQIRSALDRAA